jgi:hypothetical protein
MQRVLRRVVTLSFLFVTACDDATAPVEACQDDIDVTVSGSQPVFSWMPNCGISQLIVSDAEAAPEDATVWGFSVPELDPLGSGVVYGVSPSRATVFRQPLPLQAGRTYEVIVRFTVGGDVVTASGSTTFAWNPD